MSAWRRIVSLCRLKVVDDTKKTQQAQLDLGPRLPDGQHELHDGAYVLNPYGVTSNPPAQSDALVIFLNAERTLGVVVGVNYKDGRPTGLKPGEAALFNAVKKTILKMADDGKAHLTCDLVVDGAISASKTITAQGAISSEATVTARSKGTAAELGAVRDAYHDHKHTGVQTGGGVTGPSDHLGV